MSSGMNMEEAEKIADKMSYREAIMNYVTLEYTLTVFNLKMEKPLEIVMRV